MKRMPLFWSLFVSMSVSSALTLVASGLFARSALARAFDTYLFACGQGNGQGMGMGGAAATVRTGLAEQEFIGRLDGIIAVATLAAIVLASVLSYFAARSLARPVVAIEAAALAIAEGRSDVRVEPSGPEELVSLGESFNHMADSLERSETLRARMVSDVAHELRTPIASLRLQLEGIVDGVISPDAPRFDSLLDDVVMLGALVDDLRALSRAEEGAVALEPVELDLVELVEREVRRAAEQWPAELAVTADVPDGALLVHGDELRLREMLGNLLANARRHTRQGTVTVRLKREDGFAVVSVEDTGEGISDEDLPFIFERLYRSDRSRAVDTGGSGIGLAVVKGYAVGHGGDVFARHTPGGGATVGFRIPAVPEDPSPVAA